MGPAYEGIAGLEVACGRTPAGHGQPLSAIDGGVSQVLADQRGVVQIVVLSDEHVAALNLVALGEFYDLEVIEEAGGLTQLELPTDLVCRAAMQGGIHESLHQSDSNISESSRGGAQST